MLVNNYNIKQYYMPTGIPTNIDTTYMTIKLEGIRGYVETPNFIGNIPITSLNMSHMIYLYNPEGIDPINYIDTG